MLAWDEVCKKLSELKAANQGVSGAQKGTLTIDGEELFIKIGTDEYSQKWIPKEIKAYAFLHAHAFPHTPRVLAVSDDGTGFATSALLPRDGWEWASNWNERRIDATLAAMDELAAIIPTANDVELLAPVLSDNDNGWVKLYASDEMQTALEEKLIAHPEVAILQQLDAHVERAAMYRVRHDTVVHDDVRADNCAWNEASGEVRLVDWNWLELGDRRIDVCSLFVHIQESGFDVLPTYAERLEADTLHWLAGFWLEAASKPLWPEAPPTFRDMQLGYGLTALRLSEQLGSQF